MNQICFRLENATMCCLIFAFSLLIQQNCKPQTPTSNAISDSFNITDTLRNWRDSNKLQSVIHDDDLHDVNHKNSVVLKHEMARILSLRIVKFQEQVIENFCEYMKVFSAKETAEIIESARTGVILSLREYAHLLMILSEIISPETRQYFRESCTALMNKKNYYEIVGHSSKSGFFASCVELMRNPSQMLIEFSFLTFVALAIDIYYDNFHGIAAQGNLVEAAKGFIALVGSLTALFMYGMNKTSPLVPHNDFFTNQIHEQLERIASLEQSIINDEK